jgi:replicative DNA helicase
MHMQEKDIAIQFDRLPPHSIDAEKCLIASMLLDRDMLERVLPMVDRNGFYSPDHQIICTPRGIEEP